MSKVVLLSTTLVAIFCLLGQTSIPLSEWRPHRIVSLEYPALAAQARIAGVIDVDCMLSEEASVTAARVKKGNDLLARAARENAPRLSLLPPWRLAGRSGRARIRARF